MSERVIIRHPDGREYGISPSAFTHAGLHPDGRSYADAGFQIVGHEDGAPYEPAPPEAPPIVPPARPLRAARTAAPTTDGGV